MTADEWNDLSWWTEFVLDSWRGDLARMIRVLKGWEAAPPKPSYGGPGSQGQESTGCGPDFNQRLDRLGELIATRSSEEYGEALLEWVDGCLEVLRGYDTAFKAADEVKALADLQAIKDGYNRLCAFAQERPL